MNLLMQNNTYKVFIQHLNGNPYIFILLLKKYIYMLKEFHKFWEIKNIFEKL